MIRANFIAHIRDLQERICGALEQADGAARFVETAWQRSGGGGGQSRAMADGAVFEKGGVNISAVHGALPAGALGGAPAGGPFYAAGISLVMHPLNPYVPTVHMNLRLFELMDPAGEVIDRWFGGGMDLTPFYLFKPDVIHFHHTLKQACDTLGSALYPRFKLQCDEYFVNKHRDNENRGVGGIFFDELRACVDHPIEDWLGFVKSCGEAFLPAYLPLVARHKDTPYGGREIDWQEHRRGRYVEFNLVHDRGTVFGLRTGGRTESILMSLPPRAQWRFNDAPQPGSLEAELVAHLAPRDWLAERNADMEQLRD